MLAHANIYMIFFIVRAIYIYLILSSFYCLKLLNTICQSQNMLNWGPGNLRSNPNLAMNSYLHLNDWFILSRPEFSKTGFSIFFSKIKFSLALGALIFFIPVWTN